LFDYMMAARPVLQCIDAPAGYVERSGCGVCVASDDPEEVARATRTLLALPREELERMGQRGREYVLTRHTYPTLAARFLEAIEAAGNAQAYDTTANVTRRSPS
jgi:glycosyltransferase involved in cell wall biosynthesis